MFRPHDFKTKVLGAPTITIDQGAYDDMWHLVDEVKLEVGWLGVVEQKSFLEFHIKEIFLIEQDVSAAMTELDETGLAKLYERLLDQPNGVDKVNALRFWGHSHVNMETSPSGQDETQMDLFKKNECNWFIRGIFNKHGKAQFDVFYFDLGISFRDVEWKLVRVVGHDPRRDYWKGEITAKVKEKVYTAAPYKGGGYTGYGAYGEYGSIHKGYTPDVAPLTYREGKYYRGGVEVPTPYKSDRHPIYDDSMRSNRDPVKLDRELDRQTREELRKEFAQLGIQIDGITIDPSIGPVSEDPAVVQEELKKLAERPKTDATTKPTDKITGKVIRGPGMTRSFPPGVDPEKVRASREPVTPRNGDTLPDTDAFGFSDDV
jgi:hypothetical protein